VALRPPLTMARLNGVRIRILTETKYGPTTSDLPVEFLPCPDAGHTGLIGLSWAFVA
jgi:hypothetical protein